MHNINIIGGGLFGILLAKSINKKLKNGEINFNINLFEKSDSVLSAWKSREVSKYFINNGFHGIEMPRAKETISMLNDLGCNDLLEEISNLRLISINKKLIRFDSDLNEWPYELQKDYKHLLKELKLENIKSKIDFDESINVLKKTYIGNLLEKCSLRYGDNFYDSWYWFYPWFFPSEFKNPNSDEGALFQSDVRKKILIPSYIIPKNFIFESLITKIEKSLCEDNINLNKNHKVDLNFIKNLTNNNQSENINIWSASSFELIRLFDSNKAISLLSNKRNMHLLLFSPIKLNSFFQWEKQFERGVSEIICVDEKIPNIARISFPKCKNKNSKEEYSQTILVEYISQKNMLSNDEIISTSEYLDDLFDFKINYLGNTFGRTIYNLPESSRMEARKYLDDILNNLQIKVPNIYWGPINMSKCGIMASQHTNQIFN